MSKAIYWGGGTSRKVKKVYLGINGVSHKVKKGYIGDESGKARLFYSSGRVWKKYNATRRYTYYWDRFNIKNTYKWNKYSMSNARLSNRVNYSRDSNDDTWYLTGNGSAWAGGLYNYTFSPDGKEFSNGRNQLPSYGSEIHDMAQGSACGYYKSHEYRKVHYARAIVVTTTSPNLTTKFFEVDFNPNDGNYYVSLHVYDIVPGTKQTLLGEVTGNAQNLYPTNGSYNGNWYEYTGVTQSKGSTQYSDVSSSSRSAYPDNGVSGNYWYVYDRSSVSYSQGSYISDVEADPGTYPANGRHSDGYWYVLQPE